MSTDSSMPYQPDARVTVGVAYARPQYHWTRSVSVAVGATVGDVLLVSGFRQAHPGWDILPAGVGIDGRLVDLATSVHEGDRVEVYRALSFDPMVSRRRRAAHKARRAATSGSRAADAAPAEGFDAGRLKADHRD